MINIVVGYNLETQTFSFIDYENTVMTEEFNEYIKNETVIDNNDELIELLENGLENICYIYYIPNKGDYSKTKIGEDIPKDTFKYIHDNYNKNVNDSSVERNNTESIVYMHYKRKANR